MTFFIIIFFTSCVLFTDCIEYIYPITYLCNGLQLYMHQKNDKMTVSKLCANEHVSVVAPWYNPAYVRFVPDKNAISFIDSGRIRIQNFAKRSARSLELSKPLQHIRSAEWINNTTMIINAIHKNQYGIFFIDSDGNILQEIVDNRYDLLFPQYYEKNTYYICRKIKENKQTYTIECKTENGDRELISFQDKVLSFLRMVNNEMGFFLSCNEKENDDEIIFTVNKLYCMNNIWISQSLFNFCIPIIFLDPESEYSFFEGMLPLLPKYDNNYINYIDIQKKENKYIFLYKLYDIKTKKVLKVNKEMRKFFITRIGD